MPVKPILSALVLTAAGLASGAAARDSIETPSYEVIDASDTAELRHYAPKIVAEVTVEAASADQASSRGFNPLANYIFGANRPGEDIAMTAPVSTAPIPGGGPMSGGDGDKIAMTAPVTTAPEDGEGAYLVQFVMPSRWTMETLPAPVNKAIRIREEPAQFVVAAGWTGRETDAAVARAEAEVAAFIEARGLTAAGPFVIAGFDGPDTPPADRMWEVQQRVETPEG